MARFLLLAATAALAAAIDNGRGVKPPMGWRSWNQLGAGTTQWDMVAQMSGLADRSRTVGGVPTSLADLGYNDCGLDDFWQQCGSYGPNHYTYHDGAGYPVVNPAKFPDMINMTTWAHTLNLTAGWYGNNCDCSDHCSDATCYAGDAAALIEFGYDSIKLDNCGVETDLNIWSGMFNQSGRSIMIENCHWGLTLPNATWCPFNYYRSSGDIRANYGSMVANLESIILLAAMNLSTPGCWAFPDALEVGVYDGPGGTSGDSGMSFVEARTHFGAWCVTSSPLILAFDMTNATAVNFSWPIVTNKQAIAINQAWYGASGNQFSQASATVTLSTQRPAGVARSEKYGGVAQPDNLSVAQWTQWAKPLNATSVAVFVMNNDVVPHTIPVNFTAVPGLSYSAGGQVLVHDVWAQADIGTFTTSWTANLVSHDSAFITLTTL